MSDIRSQEQIEEMRQRLYARGANTAFTDKHDLADRQVNVSRDWNVPAAVTEVSAAPVTFTPAKVEPAQPRNYRKFVLLGSLAVFVLGSLFAGAFWYLGQDNISGENINLNISGPSTIGGSETMSFQVGITNQNTVAVDAAVLVLKYPAGTRSVEDPPRNLNEERITVGTLAPGEAKNMPVQVGIYGKENDARQIEATLEYRITGSDGTFYKVAEPLRFQITSSPVIMQIGSTRKVSAGQDVDITLTVKSNTSSTQKDIIVSAELPNGFTFKSSEPEPIYNQNTWKIDELRPEQSVQIKIKGTINGLINESFGIDFKAGAAQEGNQFIVGSLLAEARTEFVIESPFLDVGLDIAGDKDGSAVLEQGRGAPVVVTIKNTLEDAVYDMVVEVVPSGNALSASSIDASGGYYDSNKGVVRWEVSNTPSLRQVSPGDTRTLNFGVRESKVQGAASFEITVNVYARRVAEQSAQEQLVGTAKAGAKYAASASVLGQVNLMSGPVPPQVGQPTTYLVALVAEAGANNMSNVTVKTSLPTYVSWLNDYSGSGSVNYNPVTKELDWNVGDIDGEKRKELIFAVSILPSLSQVGITPFLTGNITLQAGDRFTNTPLSAYAGPVSAELPAGTGYTEGNGTVVE